MDYAPSEGVNVRPTFYDFNAIYHPISNKKVVPEFQGGIGGADIKFYLSGQSCVASQRLLHPKSSFCRAPTIFRFISPPACVSTCAERYTFARRSTFTG